MFGSSSSWLRVDLLHLLWMVFIRVSGVDQFLERGIGEQVQNRGRERIILVRVRVSMGGQEGLERREREVEEEDGEKKERDRGFLSGSLNFFLSRSRNPDRKGSPVGATWLSCGV